MSSAIFLDRDGVIIQNRENYVCRLEDVEFLPYSLSALNQLGHTPYKIIIITNQSAINRGMITLQQAELINQFIIEKIHQHGGRVDGLFMCPHSPDENCSCRKPLPGLLFQAAESLCVDLPTSIMIGDALTDMQAGSAAGIKTLIMVKTGRGQEQYQLSQSSSFQHIILTDDLLTSASLIATL